jgi:hypothetical protein
LLVIMLVSLCAAAPATAPQIHAGEFRVQLVCINDGRRDDSRLIDVSASDDEGAVHSAEGLVSPAQAARVIDVLAADGMLDRAKPSEELAWRPPATQTYYIAQLTVARRSPDVFEFRPVEPGLLKLLVNVRDAIGRGPAGRSADRAIAAIDPAKLRWPASTRPTSRPIPRSPALPQGESSLHPGYSFRAIDPKWKIEEEFLKPGSGVRAGEFAAQFRWEEPDDDFTGFFRELTYMTLPEERTCKTVTMYPSGHVYIECDSYEHGVDFPQGDVYRRVFRDDGALVSYTHSKDGRLVDAFCNDADQGTMRVIDGRGFLRQPTFDPLVGQDMWFYEGLPLVERTIVHGTCVNTVLHDNGEPGHNASLTIDHDGSERLLQDGDEWQKASSGQVARRALYRADEPSTNPSELMDGFRAARGKFTSRFSRRAQAAGFSFKEMEVQPMVGAEK